MYYNQNYQIPQQPQDPNQSPKKQGKGRKIAQKALSLVLSGALLGSVTAGSFYGVRALVWEEETQTASSSTASTSSGSVATLSTGSSSKGGMDVSDVAEECLPCVVAITNVSVQEVQNFFNRFGPNGSGQTQLEETSSCGSGVIIASDDDYFYIVSNQHVVEGATTLSVSFVDNTVCQAQLCGTDEEVDIAVLKVARSDLSADTISQIAVVDIGDSDSLEVGEQVVAIGNALGYGQSVTTGIVSALDRSVTNENGSTSTYIQTDAAINPGNSGGALLNMDGELIGINTAKLSSTEVEGMGYTIPISDVLELIGQLMKQTTDLTQQSTSSQQSYTNNYSGWYFRR